MTRAEVRHRIEEVGIVPAIRVFSHADALFAAAAVFEAGIPIVEVTMTVPGAVDLISQLVRTQPELLIGAGTVFDTDTAQQCIDAGARFLTSTGLDLDIVKVARDADVLIFPGVLTPTEVHAAQKAGCDIVKVFPCAQVGGPDYIRALRAPFPKIDMIASGGVTQTNAAEFINAGATALGIGGDLIPRKAIGMRESHWIQELARRFSTIVREARAQ
jgi:2-dehydro-3-deoxyphosphogluconate aldolase / (4S)-4-hydroxy-2-oxoglutarate aldolase